MGGKYSGLTTSLLADETGDTSWMRDAECRRTHPTTCEPVYHAEMWFPVGTTGPAAVQAAHAKAICRTSCPVVEQCTAWAVDHLEYGVAGGMDEEQRRDVRRARARERRAQAEVAS